MRAAAPLQVPEVSFRSVLDIGRDASSPEAFAVVRGSPVGETDVTSQIHLLFNRPLVELGNAESAAPPLLLLSPPVPGSWRFVGSHAVIFEPKEGRLPYATRITVEVPGDLKALDGSALGKAHVFSFETPAPRLLSSYPSDGSEGLEPSFELALRFNQRLLEGELARATELTEVRGEQMTKLPFDVAVDPSDLNAFKLRPKKPLPTHASFRVRVAGGLRGAEGPLVSGVDSVLTLSTYDALAIKRVGCWSELCEPGSGINVELNNPVRFGDFRRALRVDPPVKLRWYEGYEAHSEERQFYLDARFRAGQTYRISLPADLRDIYGQRLGQTEQRTIAFANHNPAFELGIRGDVLEAGARQDLAVGLLNTPRVELRAKPLSVLEILGLDVAASESKRFQYLEGLPGVIRRDLESRSKSNTLDEHWLPFTELGGLRRGALGLALRDPNTSSTRTEVVQVTDLGISAKVSRGDSVVWVTSLSTGRPVPGAQIEVHGVAQSPGRFVTNSEGIARFSLPDMLPASDAASRTLIVARQGDDWAFRRVRDALPEWRYDVTLDLFTKESDAALLFTDRGIYRPGDTVRVKGIVRGPGEAEHAIAPGKKFVVDLAAPDGARLSRSYVALGEFGSWHAALAVPESGSLGHYVISLRELDRTGKPEERALESTSFQVADYRPAEFLVAVDSDRPSYVRGDEVAWTVRSDYLYGAPMKGAPLSYRTERSHTRFVPNGAGALVTTDDAYSDAFEERAFIAGTVSSQNVALDGTGQFAAREKVGAPDQAGPELLTLDAEVTDVTRQAGAASRSVLVHPAEFYLGIASSNDGFLTSDSAFKVSALALSPSGEKLVGRRITLELFHRKWSLVREATAEGGYTSTSRRIDVKLGACAVQSARDPVSCGLKVGGAGAYIVRATSQDARGNAVRASVGLYAVGAGEAWWGEDDSQKLALVPDKNEYRLGDVARVLVKSPFREAEALVTVEKDSVISAERRTLRGSTPVIEVPITEALRPNAFLSVLLVRPRSVPLDPKRPLGLGAPTYRLGVAELKLESASRRLDVALRPSRTELSPGEELSVEVLVQRADRTPALAEVTLYAADEGVLALTAYETPDPLPVFSRAPPLRVATLESRETMAEVGLPELRAVLGLDKGAPGGGGEVDAGGSGAAPRRDFRHSAYFNPSLVTAEDGRVTARFKLPESLSTYRIMAVAAAKDDRYGFASARVVTSKPLMARPALPRFLRAGDKFQAAVAVSTKGVGPTRADVTVSAPGLELSGPNKRSIDLPAGQAKSVEFSFSAPRKVKSPIRFDVAAGELRDAVEIERSVEIPLVVETVALYGKTQESVGERLAALDGVRRDVGGLELSVSSTALIGLDAGFEQLIDYPYGCTEQIASRLLPLSALAPLAADFSIPLPKDIAKAVRLAVGELVSRQQSAGGFLLWPEASEAHAWASAYALFALHHAKRQGAAVPARVFERGRAYLRKYLETAAAEDYAPTRALALDVLAELGHPDDGYAAKLATKPFRDNVKRLYDERARLPLFAQALVLHALALSGTQKAEQANLVRELENRVRLDGREASLEDGNEREYPELFDSPARTQALVLRALLTHDGKHELAAPLARGLLARRAGGTWRTTQETAYALLALDQYRREQEREVPSFLARTWLGKQLLFSTEFRGRTLSARSKPIAMAELGAAGASLVFEKIGAGTLFYEARLRYALSELPTSPLDRGFHVEKQLAPYSPALAQRVLLNGQSSVEFNAGDVVVADVFVVATGPRKYVVLDDPLPAGFEALDVELATSSERWAGVDAASTFGSGAGPRTNFDHAWFRRELRDSRALFFIDDMPAGLYHYRYLARATTRGTFVLPPTSVLAMYAPELLGRTGAESIVVR